MTPVEGDGVFDDLLAANRRYQEAFPFADVPAGAARGLAVLTCIDSRIEPLQMLGLEPGDAKIVRNAGARVTDDVLRSLALAVHLLAVERICVVQHTGCAVAGRSEEELRGRVADASGLPIDGWDFLAIEDQRTVLVEDVARLRTCDLLPPSLVVGGFIYDVATGGLDAVC